MSPNTQHPLLSTMQQAGIITNVQASKLTGEVAGDATLSEADLVARLVEQRVLTAFQAEQVLAGRAEECVLAGRYQILSRLGEGGMGVVYKAHDTRLDRPVAVKVVAAHHLLATDAVARFRREIKALAHVSHPAIVQAYDAGEDRGRHFLVMEYVEGESLFHVLHRQGRVAPARAAEHVYQAALGLQHAHERGLIHRDLKPANLLLSADRQIKILDLGLARFFQDQIPDPGLTHEGAGLGTPDYMAPEQFSGAHHVDPRADLYALGCTLYHLVTGRVPFPGTSLSQKAQAHEQQEPTPVEQLCPEVPAGLVLAIQRMMAKSPDDRFQTAQEAAEALAPYVASGAPSSQRILQTKTWHGSLLSFQVTRPYRRSLSPRRAWLLAGGAVAAAAAILLAVLLPALLSQDETPATSPPALPDKKLPVGPVVKEEVKPTPPKPVVPVIKEEVKPTPPKVVTFENGLTVAQDGTGQYRTITAAMEAINRPGMTVRVLDDATYVETVMITNRAKHEGLTLEAVKGAMIKPPPQELVGVMVQNVPRVTLRGFRMRTDGRVGQNVFLVGIISDCPGSRVEDLMCQAATPINTIGITIEGPTRPTLAGTPPVVVQHCSFEGFNGAIRVSGSDNSSQVMPCRRVVLRQNRMSACQVAVHVTGQVHALHVVGNRITGCDHYAIGLFKLFDRSGGILIANNTVQGLKWCLAVQDPGRDLRDVIVCNNVLIAEDGPDMVVLGKKAEALTGFRIYQNWRQVRP